MGSETIDRYGVMGYPVSHSRSPVIHRLFALQTRQNLQYELLAVEPEQLESAIRQFAKAGGKGLNITMPHKSSALPIADQLSERATDAGAINTLAFQDGEIFGDNTDGIGLMRDLTRNLELTIRDANILVLGAGGATRGILGPLLAAQPARITIANRTLSKARDLADWFGSSGNVIACRFKDVPASPGYSLVVNATSAGLRGEIPPYPDAAIGPDTFCYDLSYGLTPTPFSKWATAKGAKRSVMGWGMLVEQAAESFHLWRGVRPDTRLVLKQITITAS
jgi:shikimate dehydrogenase